MKQVAGADVDNDDCYVIATSIDTDRSVNSQRWRLLSVNKVVPISFPSSFFFLVSLVVLYLFIIFPFTVKDKIWQDRLGGTSRFEDGCPTGDSHLRCVWCRWYVKT